MGKQRRCEFIKLLTNELRDLNLFVIVAVGTVLLASNLFVERFQFQFRLFFFFFHHLDHFHNLLIMQRIIAVIFKQRADLQHKDDALLLLFGKIIEEKRHKVQKRTKRGHQDERGQHLIEQPLLARGHVKNIERLRVTVALIDAEMLFHGGQHRGGQQRHQIADCRHCCEHAVDALAAAILLIVADVRLNRRRRDLLKRGDQRIEINAKEQPPDIPHIDKHEQDEHDVQPVHADQRALFAEFADYERRQQHAPECGVAIERVDQRQRAALAGVAVGIGPCEDVLIGHLQKAEPSGQRNDPEILVLCHFLKRIDKADLDRVGLGLHNLFLRVGIDDDGQQDADHGENGIAVTVDADIIKVVVRQILCHQGRRDVHDGRRQRIDNGLDGQHIGALLGAGRKHVDQIGIGVVEKLEEELQQQVEHQHRSTGGNVAARAAEQFRREPIVQPFIGEPDIADGDHGGRNAHREQIRPVFAALAARVVHHLGADRGQRNVGDRGNQIEHIHIRRRNADGAADDHVRRAHNQHAGNGDNEIGADAAACIGSNFAKRHIPPRHRVPPIGFDLFEQDARLLYLSLHRLLSFLSCVSL